MDRQTGRLARLAGGVLLALAAFVPASAQDIDPRDGEKFEVILSPRMILPPDEPHEAGERRVVKPDEVVLRAPLGWLFHGKVVDPVSFDIAGLAIEIGPEESLRRAMIFTGGDLSRFPEESVVYCQREKTDDLKNSVSALTLGLSDLATRISRTSQACLMDTDGNGRFDHAFLVGLKREEDLFAVEIEESTDFFQYTADESFAREEGDFIEVRFNDKPALLGGHGITTRVFLSGIDQGSEGIYWFVPQLGDRQFTPMNQHVKRGKLPQMLNFATSVIQVHSYDDETREIEVEYMRDFTCSTVTIRQVYYY